MKKLLLSIIMSTVFLSCTDFIEHEGRGTQNLDTYFQTDEECQTYVNGLYATAFYIYDWWQLTAGRIANEAATDDAWMGNTGQDASDMIPAAQYVIAPNRMGYISDIYRYRYENISNCNLAIEHITDAPIKFESKSQYLGEALFLRAYDYFELVNNFGGVPLVLKSLSSSGMNMKNSSKEEIYAQIVEDLLSAISLLRPTSGPSNGKASQWSCKALLARVYLFQGKWQEAYDCADDVISNGGFSLEEKFLDIWNVDHPNSKETIFEVQTSSVSDKNLGNMMCVFTGARGELKDNFPSGSDKDVMPGWGWGVPTSDLENCYLSENDEIRRRSTITINGEAAYGDEKLNPTHKFDLAHNKSGRIIRKYYVPVATRRTLINKQTNVPLNVPVLRLAEMYLTRAEASWYLKNINGAMDDVDFVRARVGLDPKKGLVVGNEALRAIWKERRMELAFEGLRLYDIRRQIDPDTRKPVICSLMGADGSFVKYNTVTSTDKYETTNKKELQDKGVNFDVNKHLVWPIPQSEIDRSNGTITQNPNY